MVPIQKITGRLGNQMFQFARLYALSRKEGTDFYSQDPKYYDDYRSEIQALYGEGIGSLPYCAIHLRVGKNPINPDEPAYIDNDFYVPLCKTGYYIDAINLFPEDTKFLVFSDNIEFARAYFEGGRFAFDDSKDDLEAFNKMASCDSQIIANSSFSWWAAYLNQNPSRKVVAPTVDKWYADGKERTVCPLTWIRV